jgi:hypothetical protein
MYDDRETCFDGPTALLHGIAARPPASPPG